MSETLVAGIDLSGRSPEGKRHTAVAWLTLGAKPQLVAIEPSGRGRRAFIGPKGDERLIATLQNVPAQVIAIDAPLTLPHAVLCDVADCSRCLPTDGRAPASYTQRWVDTGRCWPELPRQPMSTAQLAALAFRAGWLARAIQAQGLPAPIETYPAAVYRRLGARPEMRGIITGSGPLSGPSRWDLLQAAGVGGLDLIDPELPESDDPLDAVAAALAAWHYAIGDAESRGDDEGVIWVPA